MKKQENIKGEVYTCPDCGETTEVYSRITGYYRPVQNFNDGKAQEFKDRRVYDIIHSSYEKADRTVDHAHCCPEAETKTAVATADATFTLFATKTCPKCKIAAQLLEQKGISYEKLFVEDNVELAKKLGLKQAPSLVIYNGDEATVISDLPAVKEFIENM